MNLLSEKCGSARLRKAILAITLLCLFVSPSALMAEGGCMAVKDPMIKITSLPTKLDVHAVLAKVSADVSRATGLDETLITYFWQTFDDIYCAGCKGAGIEGGITFVDLYVPGFMTDDDITKVMTSLADSLEKNAAIDKKSIFIHTHVAQKNQLYIMGEVVTDWAQVDGSDQAAPAAVKK